MIKKTLQVLLLSAPLLLFAASMTPTPAPTPTPPTEQTVDTSDVKPEALLPKPGGDTNLPEGDGYKAQFIKTLAAILIVLILVVLAILLFRRFAGVRPLQMNSRKHIKVIERRPLSPNTYLYYIEVGNKQFVVSESKLDVRTVANLDWTETNETT